MQVSVPDVVSQALRLCGQMGQPGRGPSPEQLAEVIVYLNQMLDNWNVMRNSIYTIDIARYTLTPSQTIYTIGPTGNFVADRPIRIENANLVLTGQSPEVFIPLSLLNDDQWALISVEEIPTTVPVALYDDYGQPNSNLYFWGFPTQANDVQLFTWKKLPTSLTSSDNLIVPDGYMLAIIQNLAVQIGPLYWKRTNVQFSTLVQQAQKSRAAIASLNTLAPLLPNDASFIRSGPQRPYFNYLIGQ